MLKNKRNSQFWKLQLRILVIYICLIIVMTSLILALSINTLTNLINDKCKTLINTNSQQIQLNINNYLNDIEKTSTLLYLDDINFQYSPTDSTYEKYEKIKIENEIFNNIVEIGLLKNYADFCIIYENNQTIGWISNNTKTFFADKIYETFNNLLTDDTGWAFSLDDNKDRIYFLRRLNKDAILITSFYSKELDDVFQVAGMLEGTEIRLITKDNQVIYSTNRNEISEFLNENVQSYIDKTSKISNKYIVNVKNCDNGWRIVTTVPTDTILTEIKNFEIMIIMLSVIFLCVFFLIGVLLFRKFSKPIVGVVSELETKAITDQLTNLLNKSAFETSVINKINNCKSSKENIFIMVDIDNFKKVNDTLGHDYGDKIITRTAKLLKLIFDDDFIIGRIGGDEFSIYAEFDKKLNYNIKNKLDELYKDFDITFELEKEKCDLSLSVGVVINKDKRTDFDEMYRQADTALYTSKKNEKGIYTFYDSTMN